MTTEAWQTCRCGKEFYVRGITAAVPTPCRACACASDMFVALDICPESMPIPGGASSCRLTYRHTGRCEPFEDIATITSSGPPAHETTGAEQ